MRKVSKKRSKQLKEYKKVRENWLEDNYICERCGSWGNEIHHKRGRFNERLNDTDYFMTVCSPCHRYIHDNSQESYDKGWLISK